MPYFEVQINNRLIACAGADDIKVLSAHVMVGQDGQASFGTHGMRQPDPDTQEHLSWESAFIERGDLVRIAYVMQARPTHSTSDVVRTADQAHRLAQLEEIRAETEARLREAYPDGVIPVIRAPHPISFHVCANDSPSIHALLSDEEYLQAVLTFSARGCVFEVDALTVLESGDTKGRRWLEKVLSPGQHVEIVYDT